MEAYEAAGGQVLRDLFARDDESGVWFEDPLLLEKLATGKLQAAADELATRWKWAVAMIEVEWGDTARYGRIEPAPAERPPEGHAEIERLEARQAELAELDDEAWTEELVAEAESIQTRLDEIEGGIEARAVWSREDFAMAGCIVTIAHDGTGCRRSEIVQLRRSEVHEEYLVLADSKAGPRRVPLNSQARRILERQTRDGSPFVFPSPLDPSRPRSPDLRLWYRVRREAGIEDVRLHDLRHTHASHAVMNGVPVPVVARLLGHSNVRMTLRYAHLGDRDIEAAAERVGQSIATIMKI